MIGPRGCIDCLAWGRLGGRRCIACSVFRHDNPDRDRCAGCDRVLAIKNGYCRMCWHQAVLDGNAAGRRRGTDAAYLHGQLELAPIRHHQLFFDRMKYRRASGPVHTRDRRGRPRKTAPPPAGPPHVAWIQPPLFTIGRDYTRIIDSTAYPAGPPGPWLAWARHLARLRSEARGWHPALLTGVDRILTILLSDHIPGDTITITQIHTLCKRLGVGAERVCEVLSDMDLLVDDRQPGFDVWLQRKLTGLTPGIRSAVEAWLRTLHDGGPRSRARHPATVWNYLNKALPSLHAWSNRYAHLREVTRDDIIAELDARNGVQRENLLVALRSLFRHCTKTRTIFRNATIRIKVGQRVYGVFQPLHPDDVDQAVTAATTPAARLVLALAAVHAARTSQIRVLRLDDVDLGNRRIIIAGRIRPMDDLTHQLLRQWLEQRQHRWPATTNPYLLINQQTATETGPVSTFWTKKALRGHAATLEGLRRDRQLEEALTHGGDPLHLAAVFGIDAKTAIRYATTARRLLESAAEHHDTGGSPRTQGRKPSNRPENP
ncbi:hypothetical protein BG844_21280 [Couchioplanes caeruleus subsp. caeruleus]|uniref:Core-binding (CB) domain-containing protein n=2 Tax=Couchioplanes caeruleus TaxID=56438 RepID=A0A1K0FHP7_9ACTN|nr:hypothetical protein BG844_21280 [Couchioplanes caeruleus subsp. caeruleus]